MRKFTIARQDYAELYALIELMPEGQPAIHRGLFATKASAQAHQASISGQWIASVIGQGVLVRRQTFATKAEAQEFATANTGQGFTVQITKESKE